MTPEVFDLVDEEAHVVLTCIRDGIDDTHRIGVATTLTNGKINQRFRRLADLGLLTIHTHDGRVTRVTNGVRRNFEAPKSAELTALGQAYFEWTERNADLGRFQATEYAELVERVHVLETQVDALETAHAVLRAQMQRVLRAQLQASESGADD